MKKITPVVLILSFILTALWFTSCGNDNNSGDILGDILQKYKTDGLTSWWEVVALYNAGENPVDYENLEELLLSLEGTTNVKMASYVIVANIAVINGKNSADFPKYEEYKSTLKNLLENPADNYTLNDYIFSYYALKSSGLIFNENPVIEYLKNARKSDGGFALSGDSGDVDVTSFAINVFVLANTEEPEAVKFLEDKINENGTFSSFGNENSNSTACALSAFVGYYKTNENSPNEIIKKASDGLKLFEVNTKKEKGYSYLKDGKADTLATAQSVIAVYDMENKTSVWVKLYIDSQTAFD